MIRLCFGNLQYGCRYAAILFAAELKRSWQQSSALAVTQEESQCVKTLFLPPFDQSEKLRHTHTFTRATCAGKLDLFSFRTSFLLAKETLLTRTTIGVLFPHKVFSRQLV